MEKRKFLLESDGFHGVWYPYSGKSCKGMILMLGDSSEDRMAVSGVKWVHNLGCHAMTMSPDKKDYGHHNYALERFGKAIAFMKANGCEKIGIAGASTTGMLALIAASYYPEDISLTIALSPCDFVMEGFYQDGKDGAHERPGENESTVSWQGKPLPYLPFAYRHPEYWKKIQEETKESGNMIASRKMFDESERRHPVREEEKIKIEKIRGEIVLVGAEDDALWDTCKYIRRMQNRLEELQHDSSLTLMTYEHGTHLIFPESMLRIILPIGSGLLVSLAFRDGKRFSKECRETRMDIDRRLQEMIQIW